jgi:hypothetical protein
LDAAQASLSLRFRVTDGGDSKSNRGMRKVKQPAAKLKPKAISAV